MRAAHHTPPAARAWLALCACLLLGLAIGPAAPPADSARMRPTDAPIAELRSPLRMSEAPRAYVAQYATPFAAGANRLAWPSGRVSWNFWRFTSSSLPNLAAGSDPRTAIRSAIAEIETAGGPDFFDAGNSSTSDAGNDGVNLITFADTTTNRALSFGAVAVTVVSFDVPSGRIRDADMVFNPAQSFDTNGDPTAFDVEEVALHEAGHFSGLDHSPIVGASMFPIVRRGGASGRGLDSDDRTALRSTYGRSTPTLGTVSGRVLLPNGSGASAVHVLAIDAVTGRTEAGTLTAADGSYTLEGLRDGIVQIAAEALDGPFSPGNLGANTLGSRVPATGVGAAWLGGGTLRGEVVSILPGRNVSAPDLSLPPATASFDLAAAGLATGPGSTGPVSRGRLSLPPGQQGWITLSGPGVERLPDAAFGFLSGFLRFTGPRTASGLFTSGEGFIIRPYAIDAGTPPGSYGVFARSGNALSLLPGLLRVEDAPTPNPGVAAYGSFCGSSAGRVALTPTSSPSLGNAGFGVLLTGAPGGRLSFLALSLAADRSSLGLACPIWVDANALLLPFPGLPFSTGAGATFVPFPIPAQANLSGLEVYTLAAIADTMSQGGFVLSNPLWIRIE